MTSSKRIGLDKDKLELANDQTANRGEQLVLRYGKSSYNRGLVDGHVKSYNVRMGMAFEDYVLKTQVILIHLLKDSRTTKALTLSLKIRLMDQEKGEDESKSHIRGLRIEKAELKKLKNPQDRDLEEI
ncbi:hypothetical protein BY996DRAFT_6523929 [Phakopsora pachyrhizi]|nr:hypothetical protein BY996DRAFT_6502769 [Phakopsora pachyrhizi]KAI8461837.1 hypothetical protein BY996DRAFT_6523929 [Phakopsora pachyrhizi]